MILRSDNIRQFINHVKDKTILCFGAGRQGLRFVCLAESWGIVDNIIGFIDNDKNKTDHMINMENYSFPVISFEKAKGYSQDVVVVITSMDVVGIEKQIEECNAFERNNCYVLADMGKQQLLASDYSGIVYDSKTPLIPKKIHYAWFGGEMPDSLKRNIEKWEEMCPDYDFFCWSEKNYDVKENSYMEEAYNAKRWGFVPDYLRLDVLFKYGGVYLDTDVEMLKKPDELLYTNAFCTFDGSLLPNTAISGASPRNDIIRDLRDYYKDRHFLRDDGTLDMTVCTVHHYRVLKKYGLIADDSLQRIKGMVIYPMIIQSVNGHTMQMRLSDKAYFAHYCALSWLDNSLHKQRMMYAKGSEGKGLISYTS